MSTHTIIVYSQDTPGVLYRLSDLFLKRKINIESLTVCRTNLPNESRFTITVIANASLVEKITKQIYKIIEVGRVIDAAADCTLAVEVAMYKVSVNTPHKLAKFKDICILYKCELLELTPEIAVASRAGTPTHLAELKQNLEPLGLIEFAQTGVVAMLKNHKNQNKI